jgi:deazaflavin-dependent oxidoreductase (nitroreductase family)
VSDFNTRIIEEFRANGGHVTTAGFGDRLVLLHHVGAKSGAERIAPLASFVDGDARIVVASAAGSPRHPAWFHNLQANPDTVIETPDGERNVTASVLEGIDRDAWWARISQNPAFADYQVKAGARQIPLVRLSPR